jgi:shikimate dehydrogenase
MPHHNKALVLGSGGAAKAVLFVLKKLGIPFINVSRSPQADSKQMSYSNLHPSIIREHTIIINTTPLGMSPFVDEAPAIPYDGIGSQHYLFDLIYNPKETKFLREGSSRGAIVRNGMEMLEIQAEENWKIWNS